MSQILLEEGKSNLVSISGKMIEELREKAKLSEQTVEQCRMVIASLTLEDLDVMCTSFFWLKEATKTLNASTLELAEIQKRIQKLHDLNSALEESHF